MGSAKGIFISAGEQSGDLHGSSLMHELNSLTSISWFGLGGDLMQKEGLETIAHIKDLASTGILEVMRKYSYFKFLLKQCAETIVERNPAAVILIDYPGFNLRLANKIREKYGGKIIYYISPQIWAWREKRVMDIKKNIDKMLVVFPFEVEFYARYGVEAEYVGHPLVKRISGFLQNNVSPEKNDKAKVITLLPGSRNDEVKHHLPVLLETMKKLQKELEIKVFISKAPAADKKYFRDILPQNDSAYKIIESNNYSYIFGSDLVMTKAGTSTMECTLLGTPLLIFYKTYPLNYVILKPLVKIKSIGIVNILTGRNSIKEFIQKDFNSEALYLESMKILTDKTYREKIVNELKEVWNILGRADASSNAAEKIYELALK